MHTTWASTSRRQDGGAEPWKCCCWAQPCLVLQHRADLLALVYLLTCGRVSTLPAQAVRWGQGMWTQSHSPSLPGPPLRVPGGSLTLAWEASGQHRTPLCGLFMAGQLWDPHIPKASGAVGLSCTCTAWPKEGGSGGTLAKEPERYTGPPDPCGPLGGQTCQRPASVPDTLASWGCRYKSPRGGLDRQMYSLTCWRPEVCSQGMGWAVLPLSL